MTGGGTGGDPMTGNDGTPPPDTPADSKEVSALDAIEKPSAASARCDLSPACRDFEKRLLAAAKSANWDADLDAIADEADYASVPGRSALDNYRRQLIDVRKMDAPMTGNGDGDGDEMNGGMNGGMTDPVTVALIDEFTKSDFAKVKPAGQTDKFGVAVLDGEINAWYTPGQEIEAHEIISGMGMDVEYGLSKDDAGDPNAKGYAYKGDHAGEIEAKVGITYHFSGTGMADENYGFNGAIHSFNFVESEVDISDWEAAIGWTEGGFDVQHAGGDRPMATGEWDAELYQNTRDTTMAPDGLTGYFDLTFGGEDKAIGVFDATKQ